MLDPQVSRFWQATLLSGLMDAQGLTACWDAIVPAKREDPENHRPSVGEAGGSVKSPDTLAGTTTPRRAQQRVQSRSLRTP